MENGIIRCTSKYIEYLEDLKKRQSERSRDLGEYNGITLSATESKNGVKYYKYRHKGSTVLKYLGSEDHPVVQDVKEARYYKESISRIDSNLIVCTKTLQRLECTDYDSINEALPNVYKGAKVLGAESVRPDLAAETWKKEKEAYKLSKGPWYPEDLKTRTADGNMVRSKSEGLIYNQYYFRGCTFVYELPITLLGRYERHPDFSILAETDWRSVILHDHQGRYGFDEDRERYNRDMYLYWRSGFIPGVNIFYTFDDTNGGFDITPTQNIIDTVIRPK